MSCFIKPNKVLKYFDVVCPATTNKLHAFCIAAVLCAAAFTNLLDRPWF